MSEAVSARERTGGRERCPYCHEDFAAAPTSYADERVTCAGCGTPHHAECFAENGGCSSLGCARREVRSAQPVAAPRASSPSLTRRFLWAGALAFLCAVVGPLGAAVLGAAFVIIGLFLRVLDTPADAPRVEAPPSRPLPFAGPERAPVHGVEILQQVLSRPASPPIRPEDFREPAGPSTPCPSCSQPLEGADELRFCYHCGASLG